MNATGGRIAFDAYNAAGADPGKTWNGQPVPARADLNDDVRAKWEAAARGLFASFADYLGAPTSADEAEGLAELELTCAEFCAGLPALVTT